MAIQSKEDLLKNQGYQNLISKGYTEEQIGQGLAKRAAQIGVTDKLNTAISNITTPVVNNEQNQGDLNVVANPSGPNVNTQEPVVNLQQKPTQTNQIAPKIDANKTNEAPVSSLFGYSTTPEEREARNLQLATGILGKTEDFNKNRTYLENTIRSYAPNVKPEDIKTTMQDIENKFNTLKHNKQLVIDNNNKLTKWDTMTNDQLAQSDLSSEDLNLLKANNPNKFAELVKFKQDKNKLDILNGKVEDKPSDITKSLQDIQTPVLDLMKVRNELFNTPEITGLANERNEKYKEVKDIQKSMKNVLDNTRKRLEGTGRTESYIRAIAQKELEAMQQQYDTAVNEYELADNKYNTLKSNADESYKTQIDQYNMNRQATQDKIDNFKLNYGIYKDQQALETAKQERQDKWDMLYNQQYFAKEQAKEAFDMKYGNIDSKDPQVQKLAVDNAVSDIMEQYKGWTFSRSKGQMIDDVMKQVKEGKTLGQALGDNITSQLQKNPNFTKWLKENNTIENDSYIEVKGSDGNTYMVNKYNPTQQYNVGGNTLVADNAAFIPDGVNGGQCGKFVNEMLGHPSYFGDSIQQKVSKKNSETPSIGGAVIMDSVKYPSNGHVAIVTGVDGDKITIKESNWNGDEKVHTRTINKNDPKIRGYYNPGLEKDTSVEITDDDISIFNSLGLGQAAKLTGTEKQKYGQFIKDRTDVFNKKNATAQELLKYSQGGKDVDATSIVTLQKFQQALNQITSISSDISTTSTDPILGQLRKLNPYDTDAQILKSKLQALIPNLARGIYGEVGVLTDADIKNYAKTIPNLTSTQDVNKGVLAMTLDTIAGGYAANLRNLARAGRDVSGFVGELQDLQSNVDSLRVGIGLPAKYSVVKETVAQPKSLYEFFKSKAEKYVNTNKSIENSLNKFN